MEGSQFMSVKVSLMAKQQGELKKFFHCCYKKESDIDDDVIEWIYVFRNALDACDIIDIAMDNYNDYDISVWMQIEDDDIMEVTTKNRTKIINEIINFTNV